jgi:hypothetical protein
MNGHQSRAFHRRVAPGNNRWPGHIGPQIHIAKIDPHTGLPHHGGRKELQLKDCLARGARGTWASGLVGEAGTDDLAAAVGPTIERYLTGKIS